MWYLSKTYCIDVFTQNLSNQGSFPNNFSTKGPKKGNKKGGDVHLLISSYFFKNDGILIDCSFTVLCGVLGTVNVGSVTTGLG